MPLKAINDRLIIKDGVIACRDGTPLAEYLKDFFKEGDTVSIITREAMLRLNAEAEYWMMRAC